MKFLTKEAFQKGDFKMVELENVPLSERDLFKMKKSEFEDEKAYVIVEDGYELGCVIRRTENLLIYMPAIPCAPCGWDPITHINYSYRAVLDKILQDKFLQHCGIIYHEDDLHDPLAVSYSIKYTQLSKIIRKIKYRIEKILCGLYEVKDFRESITLDFLLDPNPLHILEKTK